MIIITFKKVAYSKAKEIVEDTDRPTSEPDKHPIIEESVMMYTEIADKVATVIV